GAKLRMAQSLGFAVDAPPQRPCELDWPTFIVHRQRYIAGIHDSYRKRLDKAGIVVAPMRARLPDARTVECENGARMGASRILIATGGQAVKPAIAGEQLGGTSDDFFQWTAAPPRVGIVGAGYIAVELAGVLQALGSHVELFARGQRLLEGFDHEITAQL